MRCEVLSRHRATAILHAGTKVVAGEEASMPGAGIPLPSAEPEFCVVSRRNDSLGSRWRWRVYASLCVVSFGLALGFAAFGAWMVLPYSVLEMAVLYLAFRWMERPASDWERISICGDRIIVERERAGTRTRRELNSYWARVVWANVA